MGKFQEYYMEKSMNNFMFEVGSMELAQEIVENGEHGVIDFNINGERTQCGCQDTQTTYKSSTFDGEGADKGLKYERHFSLSSFLY